MTLLSAARVPRTPHRLVRTLPWVCIVPLIAASTAFLLESWRWPLIGDASQIHYICFLMDHGMAPYRVAGDMNMPGALLLEWAVMHTLGPGAAAWRGFDLLLAAVAAGAMMAIAGRGRRAVGLGAGLLFLLLHGADGVNDLGERDLSIAALLLVATAALLHLQRRGHGTSGKHAWWAPGLFGLCLGEASTIKPTVVPFAVLLFIVLWRSAAGEREDLRRGGPAAPWMSAALAGFLLPCAAALGLLLHERALGAFLHDLRTLMPYYAGLDRRAAGYLLVHSVAPLLPIVLCWLAVAVWKGPWRGERFLLAAGAVFGLFSYIVQGKGFPYYRYPLLAFLLPLVALDLTALLRPAGRGMWPRCRQAVAALALGYAAWWLGPLAAVKAHRFHWWDQQFVSSVTSDLRSLHAEDGQVQCIDSISGCGTALLRLRLVQSTGVLSDFFLFGPSRAPAVRQTQAQFQHAVAAAPPRILVVTDGLHLHPHDPGGWSKLQDWPWFQQWLARDYSLVLVRVPTRQVLWWSRPGWPAAYRIYVQRAGAPEARAELALPDAGSGTARPAPTRPEP